MLAVVLAALLLSAQESARDLVDKLKSDDVEERQAAYARLVSMGPAATDVLRRAAKDPDPDVSTLARQALFRNIAGPRLPGLVKRIDPGVEGAMEWESDSTWTGYVIELAREFNGGYDFPFRGKDLARAMPLAIRGAAPENRAYVLAFAVPLRARSVLPEILPLLLVSDLATRRAAAEATASLGGVEESPNLFPLLTDPDERVRSHAFGGVVRIGTPSTVPRLAELLAHSDPSIRASAVRALLALRARDELAALDRLAGDPSAAVRREVGAAYRSLRSEDRLPQLERMLVDPDFTVRSEAAFALAEFGSERAVPGLREVLAEGGPVVSSEALAALEPFRRAEAEEEVIGALKHRYNQVRTEALRLLQRRKSAKAAPVLMEMIDDPECGSLALDVLVELQHPPVVPLLFERLKRKKPDHGDFRRLAQSDPALAAPGLLQVVRVRAGGEQDAPASDDAVVALRRLRHPPLFPELRAMLDDPQPFVATAAAILLGEWKVEEAKVALIDRLPKAFGPHRAFWAEAALRLGAVTEAEQALRDLLSNGASREKSRAMAVVHQHRLRNLSPVVVACLKDMDVRSGAARFVAEFRLVEAKPKLLPLLNHPCSAGWAAEALVQWGARDGVLDDLLRAMRSENPYIVSAAAHAIGRLGLTDATPAVVALLKDDATAAREAAVEILGNFGAADAFKEIAPLQDDPEARVRREVALALGMIVHPRGVGILRGMLDDDKAWVRAAAVESLVELGAREALADIGRLGLPSADFVSVRLRLGGKVHVEDLKDAAKDRTRWFDLNAVRSPESWNRFSAKRFVRRAEDTKEEALERIARAAGLPLEWPKGPADPSREESQWRTKDYSSRPHFQETQPRSSLLRALEVTAREVNACPVLEADRIRLLSLQDAEVFWKAWWEAERKK